MKKLYAIVALLVLTGCGKDCDDAKTVTQYVTTAAAPTDEIQRVVDETNELRFAQGQLPLATGLTCSVYNNTGGAGVFPTGIAAFPTSLPSATATYAYVGVFNQADTSASTGLNVIPPALRSTYTQWYAVRCSGQLVVTNSSYHQFDLISDDAGLLYIDNVKVVDNDGNHGAQLRTGYRMLSRGIHSIRIDYMQGPAGNQALILNMNGSLLPANRLYR